MYKNSLKRTAALGLETRDPVHMNLVPFYQREGARRDGTLENDFDRSLKDRSFSTAIGHSTRNAGIFW